MKIQRCKGMRDLFPSELDNFHRISAVFRDSCLKWGYREVRTPTLEYLHLFTSAGTLTPGMLGKVYSFLDWDGWSGERVVLRPEATIPVARLYVENMPEKELAKFFYIENVFIFEETGQKDREKWQCGAELIGVGSPLADVELIVLSSEILQNLGLKDLKLKLSHAGLTRGILQKLGLSPAEQNQLFDRILDGDSTALSPLRSERPELADLLAIHGQSSGFIRNLASSFIGDSPELQSHVDDFITIVDLLNKLGIEFEIDISSVRGFEYYTGIIFQIFYATEKVGGGGRYDALIPAMGGQNALASGFALYLDLLMKLCPLTDPHPDIKRILVQTKPATLAEAFAISASLRQAGHIVKLFLGGQGPPDTSWKLTLQSSPPRFILTDQLKHRKLEFASPAKVLEALA